ncbi:MAG TPA: hypothetical protein VLA89_09910 [Gemmatimonadales bacterium]|nr:hypothetical protein [Gemmatimonadales bacterium]
MRRPGSCWLLAAILAVVRLGFTAPLAAQAPQDTLYHHSSPFYVKYGKFLLLGLSAGMSIKAATIHDKADESYDDLQKLCFSDPPRCTRGPDGAYEDPVAEDLYQTTLHYDDQARAWLYGGEVTLLGSAALFVWELTRPKNPPKNIPFEPEVSVVGDQTRLGFRVAF